MSSRPDPSTTPPPSSDEFAGGSSGGDGGTEVTPGAGDTGAVPGGAGAVSAGPAGADDGAVPGDSTAGVVAGRAGADGTAPDGTAPDGAASDAGASDGGAPDAGGALGGAPARPVPPRFGPRALRKPGRGETSVRDMIGALLILVPVGLLLFSVGNSCSFAPGMPVEDPDSGPTVNVESRLAEYAVGSEFPLRVPDVPFRPNSTDRGPVDGGGTAVRIGYVTPDADFLSLVQTDGTAEGVLATESGAAGRGEGPPLMRGTVDAAGLDWEVYQRDGGEPFRIATLPGDPDVRLLITGSGSDDQFRTLAEAVTEAPTAGGG